MWWPVVKPADKSEYFASISNLILDSRTLYIVAFNLSDTDNIFLEVLFSKATNTLDK